MSSESELLSSSTSSSSTSTSPLFQSNPRPIDVTCQLEPMLDERLWMMPDGLLGHSLSSASKLKLLEAVVDAASIGEEMVDVCREEQCTCPAPVLHLHSFSHALPHSPLNVIQSTQAAGNTA